MKRMEVIGANEIRSKFLEFFRERNHAVVPSSSLIPNDPSVLLTTAGMQQFKPYYTGEADPVRDFGSRNTASVQKSFRTSDIDEVGDETHLTFFEMLGNFSFGHKPGEPVSPQGGYFKKEGIALAHEFITKEMRLDISFVTVFEGSDVVPKDGESKEIWKSLDPKLDVREQGMEDVFWGPTGNSGPCGPTTEIYAKNGAGQDVEIWNIVFNQFFYPGSREELDKGAPGKFLEPLPTPGVDTGMGLERLAMVSQKKKTIFETDLFLEPFLLFLSGNLGSQREGRIIADHTRAAIFLLADGIRPSNKGAGYILRRLIRRAIAQTQRVGFSEKALLDRIPLVISKYGTFPDYAALTQNEEIIQKEFVAEMEKFNNTLKSGMKNFFGKFPDMKVSDGVNLHRVKKISGADAFYFHQSFGLTLDVMKDLARQGGHIVEVDEREFEQAMEKHQEISRAGVEKKFGGHGLVLDTGELKAGSEEELKTVTRLHTATHLLNAALKKVLGDSVAQSGSDITAERTRFDFTFPRRVAPEEVKKIELLVNYAIEKNFPVTKQVLPLEDAKRSGALYMERSRYPDPVNVYTIGTGEEQFSKELCGGPHVENTGEIGRFRIVKEESSSAGIRRIRAVVE